MHIFILDGDRLLYTQISDRSLLLFIWSGVVCFRQRL